MLHQLYIYPSINTSLLQLYIDVTSLYTQQAFQVLSDEHFSPTIFCVWKNKCYYKAIYLVSSEELLPWAATDDVSFFLLLASVIGRMKIQNFPLYCLKKYTSVAFMSHWQAPGSQQSHISSHVHVWRLWSLKLVLLYICIDEMHWTCMNATEMNILTPVFACAHTEMKSGVMLHGWCVFLCQFFFFAFCFTDSQLSFISASF